MLPGYRSARPRHSTPRSSTIVEVDADDRIAARIWFDVDDIDAAFEELDTRYLAGEAAAHSHTWSLVMAGLCRNQSTRNSLRPRRTGRTLITAAGQRFAPGDAIAYMRAAWDVAPDINIYIEAVHRLSNLGAVVTHAAHGTSKEGFEAEWREIDLSDLRRRPAQPLRTVRRGRHRRRAHKVRRTQTSRQPGLRTPRPESGRVLPMHSTAATWTVSLPSDCRTDDIEDRRKGLRGVLEGPARREVVHALFETPPDELADGDRADRDQGISPLR